MSYEHAIYIFLISIKLINDNTDNSYNSNSINCLKQYNQAANGSV